MTRLLQCSLFLLLLITLAGCDLFWNSGDSDPTSARLGEPFWIDYGETAALDDGALRITFDGTLNDSRCPKNVDCIWEGEAQIQLRLVQGTGQRDSLSLAIPGLVSVPYTEHVFVAKASYQFKLLQLDPYPSADDAGGKLSTSEASRYRALLLVEKRL
ncbi:MAG: hypothetical protein ACR2GR_06090 [Rhodothermales bacterium]